MFTQMEGLVVDKGITLCDLKGMLDQLVKKMFGKNVTTRLRPSYFPFTEPSVEVDVSCFQCHGKGCSLCKGTGWIEVLGAGVVNKKVLEGCGIDTNEYSGLHLVSVLSVLQCSNTELTTSSFYSSQTLGY